MNDKLETNILIIGKSGAGKSSLLNYLFNDNKVETGAGRPVTQEGIFTEKLEVDDDFIINVSDTWGLEADKAEAWQNLIMTEIQKHDCENISDWFHTIIYCLSAKSARVEEFEKKIIKELVDSGNKIIILLTHSDVNNVEKSIEEMSKALTKEEIGVKDVDIIKVCSVGKKLLGGRETKAFGREEIVNKIKMNLWDNICNKLPKLLNSYTEITLNNWYYNCCNIIDEDINWHNSHSNKKLRQLSIDFENSFKIAIKDIELNLKCKVSEAYSYFVKFSKKLQLIVIDKKETELDFNYKFNFEMDFIDKFAENIVVYIKSLIPFAVFFMNVSIADIRRNEIKSNLQKCKDIVEENMNKEVEKTIEELRKFKIL